MPLRSRDREEEVIVIRTRLIAGTTLLICRYSPITAKPFSRPNPLALRPPKGVCGATLR